MTLCICSYAEYLQVGFGIQKIIIGQILFRDDIPYNQFEMYYVKANNEIDLCAAAQIYISGIIGVFGTLRYLYLITEGVIQGHLNSVG